MGRLRDERTRRAVAAAVAVAREYGVRCDAPELLADKANALVRLVPAPVVARVATTTGLLRGGAYEALTREVAVAGYLAGAGAPVIPPADLLPPGPHVRDGLALTFWPYVPPAGPQTPDPDRFGGMLRDLHAVLAGYPGALPYLGTPYADIAALLGDARPSDAAPDLDDGVRREPGGQPTQLPTGLDEDLRRELGEQSARPPTGLDDGLRHELRERFARLRTDLDGWPAQALHGDAHPGNLLPARDGWRWNDLEDTCLGPVEWDLACLLRTTRLDGRVAVRAYGRDPDDPRIAPLLGLRTLHGDLYGRMVAAYRA